MIVFMFIGRKPGTTLEAFKDHYENHHVPLVLKALGKDAPLRHTRYYLQRNTAAQGDADVAPPLLWVGNADGIDYDCITTMEFEDEAHSARMRETFQNSPMKAEIEEDEAVFADRSGFKLLGVEKPAVTTRS
jgi:hypothetical protein